MSILTRAARWFVSDQNETPAPELFIVFIKFFQIRPFPRFFNPMFEKITFGSLYTDFLCNKFRVSRPNHQ